MTYLVEVTIIDEKALGIVDLEVRVRAVIHLCGVVAGILCDRVWKATTRVYSTVENIDERITYIVFIVSKSGMS